jgi:hypothetical protein
MATNDLEQLVRSIVEALPPQKIDVSYGGITGTTSTRIDTEESALQAVQRITRTADSEQSGSTRSGSSQLSADAGRLAAEVEQLRRAISQPGAAQQTSEDSSSTSDGGGSLAGTVLKTIGLVTAVGPIAAGLMSLFGGRSSEPETSFPTMPFEPPAPIAIEAGLGADRQFTGITYTADGTPRPIASSDAGRNTSAAIPPIQINVQAMDSRSFLDHSDEIARAVRQAMLHSHSLNDVVTEL